MIGFLKWVRDVTLLVVIPTALVIAMFAWYDASYF